MYNINHVSFRDDDFGSYRFTLNEDFSSFEKSDIDNLNIRFKNFYESYIDISQKYQIGEIIPVPYLENHNINLKKVYTDIMTEFSTRNLACCLFPQPNLYLTTSNREYTRIHPSSCRLKLLTNQYSIVDDYFYINYGQVKPLAKHKYNKLPSQQSIFSLHGTGFDVQNTTFLNEREIGFTISFSSEFWFEKIIWGSNNESKSNYFLAINNTPRFNSFLRDLKILWIKEMNGKFEVDFNWYNNICNDGIIINNQIIYQEDIDSGKTLLLINEQNSN